MRTYSPWFEVQRGWRFVLQLVVIAAVLVACYSVGSFTGQWAGYWGGKAEVGTLDRQMERPPAPPIPTTPFTR